MRGAPAFKLIIPQLIVYNHLHHRQNKFQTSQHFTAHTVVNEILFKICRNMCTKILCQYFYIAHYILKHYGHWLTNLTTKPTLNRSSYFKLQNSLRHNLEAETSKMDPILWDVRAIQLSWCPYILTTICTILAVC